MDERGAKKEVDDVEFGGEGRAGFAELEVDEDAAVDVEAFEEVEATGGEGAAELIVPSPESFLLK